MCLDGAHRAVAQFRDLLVGQVAVLTEQEHLFFFLAQFENGAAKTFERFLSFQGLPRRGVFGHHGVLLRGKRFGAAIPCAALHVLGRVERDAKNPGPEIEHVRQLFASVPALDKGILGGVMSVVAIAKNEDERADEFVLQLIESAHEPLVRSLPAIGGDDGMGWDGVVVLTHTSPEKTRSRLARFGK